MASIQRRLIHGRPYYYLVESRRVKGKPRPVVVKYLGKADDLLARLRRGGPEQPVAAVVREAGASAALWKLATDLRLAELIDTHAPKRSQGRSVGEYMVLATVNRCVAPTSKRRFRDWYAGTVLPRLTGIPSTCLTPQRFCEHMDYLDEKRVRAIEAELSQRLVETYDLDLRCLAFDCTNFDTFIDTRNRAKLPQRGHAKSKRMDLRVVGLALLVSTDFHVPLFWQVYRGNQPDSKTFASVSEELAERYRLLARDVERITLVFDKGNNSKKNLAELADGPFHVIGSLVPSQHQALLDVRLREFRPLKDVRLRGTQAYRTELSLYGHPWTIVITRSTELLRGQKRGIQQHLTKKLKALVELQRRLRRQQEGRTHGRPYRLGAVRSQVRDIVRGQYVSKFLKARVERTGGRLRLTYRVDGAARARIEERELGKRILFTDNHDWTTEQIILGYRSQHHVEAAFRQMKDPHFVSWSPMFHWTDARIRVHAFYCVLALTLASLLQRSVAHAGLRLTADELLEQLASISEVDNLYAPAGGCKGRPRTTRTLTRLSRLQQRLVRILGIEPLLPGST